MKRSFIQYGAGALLLLSLLACVAGEPRERLSVNENLFLTELTPRESTLLCEDISFEGPRECANGVEQRQRDFDIDRCSNQIQLMHPDCNMTARDYYDAYTRTPCRDVGPVLVCFFGY